MVKAIHQARRRSEAACKRRARELLYWSGMIEDIDNVVRSCAICNAHTKSQCKEPMKPCEVPDRPWNKVGADLFYLDEITYLITVDYYSFWFEVNLLKSTTSKDTTNRM